MVEIRTLVVSDAAQWWRVRLEALEAGPLAFGRSAEEHRAMTSVEAEARFATVAPGDLHLGAFIDGELVGMATFIRETGIKERHKGHISSVYVSAAHRRKGIARRCSASS